MKVTAAHLQIRIKGTTPVVMCLLLISSDYDDNHEQHSGNCDVCLDNSTVTWSHTHDTSTESSSSGVDTLV